MKHEYQDMLVTLEALIDKQGLTNVLAAIECVVNGKIEHLSFNGENKDLTRIWQKAGNVIYTAASKTQDLGL